jgi:hypothetical protein
MFIYCLTLLVVYLIAASLVKRYLFQGMVLLTEDARLNNSPSGITKDFAALCHRSTEYHFPTFEQQVEAIRRDHLQPG